MGEHGAGGQDWVTIWRTMYDQERAQGERVAIPDAARQRDCWSGQAQRYAAAAARNQQPDSFMQFVIPRIKPTDHVIDVGAGSGRHVPTLTQYAQRVTAIEPSAAMREQLHQRIEHECPNDRDRISVRADSWPTTDLEPADLIVASHVVYAIREIGPFLLHMDAMAKRGCYLAIGLQHPSSFISPFWEAIYGEPRLPLPAALECFNALHQLGIAARFEIIATPGVRFATIEEARADLRWRLRLSDSAEDTQRLQPVLERLLVPNQQGGLSPIHRAHYSAVVWWEK